MVQLTLIFEPSWDYTRLMIAWAVVLCMLILVVVTVLRFRKKPLELRERKLILFVCGLIVFAVLHIPFSIASFNGRWTLFVPVLFDLARLTLFTALLTAVVRFLWKTETKQLIWTSCSNAKIQKPDGYSGGS